MVRGGKVLTVAETQTQTQMAAGRVRRPAGRATDGRREVPVQARAESRADLSIRKRERQGYHCCWLQARKDVHLQRFRLCRRSILPQCLQDL